MADALDLPAPPPFDRLASEREIALFLDFDGTLVDIASSPGAISVPEGLSARLHALAARLDGRLALISGRSLDDLGGHCAVDGIACAGSHGDDRRDARGRTLGEPAVELPQGAFDALRSAARDLGLMLEAKPHGAALHFRAEPSRAAAAHELADAVATRFGLAVKHGKEVVEVTGSGANKGGAVRAFMALSPFANATPVFVGDDLTDEDGMIACNEAGGFGVLVGDRSPTSARFRLPDVPAVYQWLNL